MAYFPDKIIGFSSLPGPAGNILLKVGDILGQKNELKTKMLSQIQSLSSKVGSQLKQLVLNTCITHARTLNLLLNPSRVSELYIKKIKLEN